MRLTTKTRYALRALSDMANQPKGIVLSLLTIAKNQRIKPKYLEQILLRLRQAKIIEGKKGPGGGYFLERDPKSITLHEVMLAVGESTAPVCCVEKKSDKYCSGKKYCAMKSSWEKFKNVIDDFCDKYSLDDIIKN